MKLEAKDRMNPNLTCVATVTEVKDGKLLIHFDGWSNQYNYWCNPTSTDIHPAGWCKKYGYPLQPPNGNVLNCSSALMLAILVALKYRHTNLNITINFCIQLGCNGSHKRRYL